MRLATASSWEKSVFGENRPNHESAIVVLLSCFDFLTRRTCELFWILKVGTSLKDLIVFLSLGPDFSVKLSVWQLGMVPSPCWTFLKITHSSLHHDPEDYGSCSERSIIGARGRTILMSNACVKG